MSTYSRTAQRGGKNPKLESASPASKSQKGDPKAEQAKTSDNPKAQPTAEQMRIAQIIDTRTDDPSLKDKIKQIMDATRKTEDEVITALHDCDNDLNRAVTMLLEGEAQGEWETSGKKKKTRQASTSKGGDSANSKGLQDGEMEDGEIVQPNANSERERSRTQGGPPRLRARGSRGRENNKENEQGGEDGFRGGRGDGGSRRGRGMANGPGGRSGRGGRGGSRLGPRTFQTRDKSGGSFPRSIDTWNNPAPESASDGGTKMTKMDNWGDDFPSPEDWDNEEYTGSLADSKVFTPSGGIETSVVAPEDTPTSNQLMLSGPGQEFLQSQANQLSCSPLPVGVGALNAAQTQYLSQLTAQAENLKSAVGISSGNSSYGQAASTAYGQTENLKSAVGIGTAGSGPGSYGQATSGASSYVQTGAYPASYGQSTGTTYASTPSGYGQQNTYQSTSSPNSYGQSTTGYQSTVASSGNGTGSYQSTAASGFGASTFHAGGQSTSFTPSSATNYSSQSYNASVNSYVGQLPDGTVSGSDTTQATQPARTKTQRARVPPPSKIPQSAVEMPEDSMSANISFIDVQFGGLEFGSEAGSFEERATEQKFQNSVAATSASVDTTPSVATTASMDAGTPAVKNSQATLVNALSSKPALSSSGEAVLTDHKTSYSTPTSRVSSNATGLDLSKSDVGLASYPASNATSYQSYQSQKSVSSNVYQPASYTSTNYSTPQVTAASTYSGNQVQSNYPNSAGTNYSSQSAGGVGSNSNSTYPSNSYSQTSNAASYPGHPGHTASYPMTQSNSYHTYGYASSNQYPASYGVSTTSSQNKMSLGGKEEYAAASTASAASLTSAVTNATPSLGLASTAQTVNTTSTKVTSATTKSSVVASIPPGVQPMVGTQYIMSQGSVPYYPSPAVYSYDDIQMLQQRMGHMPTGYYDMTYQAPTSLATARDNLASVAYTMSDARYSRGDNASPVPSTLSQQTATQAHAPHFPPGYTYFYGTTGMVPGGFQYSAPAIYPMAATNAHANTTPSQYPKPGGYSSGYGSGYDALSQTQDYSKSSYVTASQGASKAGVGGGASASSVSSSSDLNMYGKGHTTLTKVNSYEKQGFLSGTPPPFNLSAAPTSGAYGPQLFIPTMQTSSLHHQPLLQDTGSSAGQRGQVSSQQNKAANKQTYNSFWPN